MELVMNCVWDTDCYLISFYFIHTQLMISNIKLEIICIWLLSQVPAPQFDPGLELLSVCSFSWILLVFFWVFSSFFSFPHFSKSWWIGYMAELPIAVTVCNGLVCIPAKHLVFPGYIHHKSDQDKVVKLKICKLIILHHIIVYWYYRPHECLLQVILIQWINSTQLIWVKVFHWCSVVIKCWRFYCIQIRSFTCPLNLECITA